MKASIRQPVIELVRRVAFGPRRIGGGALCQSRSGTTALAIALSGCTAGTGPIGDFESGSLAIMVSGLPEGGPAMITVTGDGFQRTLTGSETLTGLGAGTYSVAAAAVAHAGDLYSPAAPIQTSVISPSHPAATVPVPYLVTTGRIELTVSGVPDGTAPLVQLTSPAGYAASLTGSSLVTGLVPGEYTLTSSLVTAGGMSYLAAPSIQTIPVAAGITASAAVTYSATNGSLSLVIAGLPAGTAGAVTIAGPGGFSASPGETVTLNGIPPGGYALSAAPVPAAEVTYVPSPATQAVTVTAGSVASATVTYTSPGTSLDLRVDGVYLTQATQRYDGSVPLVAGRAAYLRAFAIATGTNQAQPPVRVRLYNGPLLVETYTIPAPAAGVPATISEGSLSASWNVLVPAALVQPGLRVMADVDPANAVAESDEGNNQFPASGTPAPVDVRPLPTFEVRFVPVLQQANGLSGNVTAGNLESFLADLKRTLPVGDYDADVREVYTTTAPVLQSNNGNNAWTTILNELLALRMMEGSSRYYYGVVRTAYQSGTAGMGFIGGTAHTAIGWDYLPSGAAVMGHEVGHNLGRLHAPCGAVLSPDPAFPYAGGTIGVWGLELNGLLLKAPSTPDLMGYCQPTWVSDYNWAAMVAYRQAGPNNIVAEGAGEGLLVWGRITADEIILEPAFRVAAPGGAGPAPGPNRVELLGEGGSVLRAEGFEAPEVGDLPGDGRERHFAFRLPLGNDAGRIRGLRVRTGGLVAERWSGGEAGPGGAAPGDPRPEISRLAPGRIAVRWDAARFPMVVVRDPASGRVLSFARGGDAVVWVGGNEVDLQFSDGVRGLERRARLR